MIQKIFNIITLLPNLFYRLFQKEDRPIKNIAIIQMAKLGDMVCTTPMFRAVKLAHPEWKLIVVGNTINKNLLSYNNDIDEYLVWDKNNKEVNFSEELKKRNIDVVIIPGPNDGALYVSLVANINKIYVSKVEGGWCPHETKTFRFLRLFVKAIPLHMNKYTPREYLYLLEPLGIKSVETKKYLFYSREAQEYAEKNITKKEGVVVVGIALSAGNKIKEWKIEKFAELSKHLINDGSKIVLIGGDGDKEYSRQFFSFLDANQKNNILDTVGNLSLDKLKAVIERLDIFIGVDTGPIYIAEAFGVPTVDILGPMSELEQPPVGARNRVVYLKNRKKPELHIMNARIYDEKEARRQIDEISVGMVLDEVRGILSEIV